VVARVKKKDHENLTNTNIQQVIKLLNPESGKPITKKAACEILNITYNTSRLSIIMEEFVDRQEYIKTRKQANRGKAVSNGEISEAITMYLQGDPIADISTRLYRSVSFVKSVLASVGVPIRPSSEEAREHIDYIPDECISDTFESREIVWAATYHTTAIVGNELSEKYQKQNKGLSGTDYEKRYSSKCYQIHVMKKTEANTVGGFSAYSLAYDLGKLTHLEQYGVNLKTL